MDGRGSWQGEPCNAARTLRLLSRAVLKLVCGDSAFEQKNLPYPGNSVPYASVAEQVCTRLSIAVSRQQSIQLVGEGLPVAVVEAGRAAGVDAAGAHLIHEVAYR